jgi:hypothetical protein
MRKLLVGAIVAAVAGASVVSVAFAANTYEVTPASGGPGNRAGSAAKPIPAFLDFGFEVGDTENLRPSVIRQYRIAAEGIKYFSKARPTCTFAQADESPDFNPACRRAIVGSGSIANAFGPANDRTVKGACDVRITLINVSNGPGITRKRGGMAIRIDGEPPACPLPLHRSIPAPFFDVRIQGIPSHELRFTVPDNLRHPAPGVDNSVIDTASRVRRVTGKVRIRGQRRTVGFASVVGRRGRTRTVRVVFVSEDGRRVTATTTFPK